MKQVIKDIFSKLMFNILKNERNNDLPFLPERIKIKKAEKLVTNLPDRTEYVIHIRSSKQASNHGKKFIE